MFRLMLLIVFVATSLFAQQRESMESVSRRISEDYARKACETGDAAITRECMALKNEVRDYVDRIAAIDKKFNELSDAVTESQTKPDQDDAFLIQTIAAQIESTISTVETMRGQLLGRSNAFRTTANEILRKDEITPSKWKEFRNLWRYAAESVEAPPNPDWQQRLDNTKRLVKRLSASGAASQ